MIRKCGPTPGASPRRVARERPSGFGRNPLPSLRSSLPRKSACASATLACMDRQEG